MLVLLLEVLHAVDHAAAHRQPLPLLPPASLNYACACLLPLIFLRRPPRRRAPCLLHPAPKAGAESYALCAPVLRLMCERLWPASVMPAPAFSRSPFCATSRAGACLVPCAPHALKISTEFGGTTGALSLSSQKV